MIVVRDLLQVFFLGTIADVRVDIPAITLMLPNAARDCRALISSDKIETIAMQDTHFARDLYDAVKILKFRQISDALWLFNNFNLFFCQPVELINKTVDFRFF